MLQLAASEKLTGQCPNCGWCPPPQNAFRPNIMNEYVDERGQTVILTESEDRVETPNGVFLRKRDDNGQLIKRVPSSAVAPPGALGGPQQQPSQTVGLAQTTVKSIPAQQTIVPSREIPAGMMKTPEEVAKTPKPTVAPVDLPTPVASNPAAPVDIAPKQP